MAILEVRNLSKRFAGGVLALDQVSLEVDRPEFVTILGPSGAGKSTLVRSINRLVQETQGEVFFYGQEISSLYGRSLTDVRKKIGMIFQQFNLIKRLSVLQNVLVGRLRFQESFVSSLAVFLSKFSSQDEEIAFECLKQVGIEEKAYHRADTLSGGQQQRVAIARTLAQNPDLLLADEPIASLDPKSSQVVMDILKRINEERKIPIIVNLHQYEYARHYASRVIGMHAGRIVFDQKPEALSEQNIQIIYHGTSV